MTAAEALRDAAARLAPVSDTPRLDAELLLSHLFGVSRETLLVSFGSEAVDSARFAALVARRAAGEPVAYITGRRDFWTLSLGITPAVLIPRPDSETLISAALELRRGRPPNRILDLGTGSGALLLAALAEWPDATGLGVDRSAAALAVARENAVALGLAPRAAFALGDWAAGLDERFDLVLANPPYVADGDPDAADAARFEPHGALFAGADGLDHYRCILPDLGRILAPGGDAILEIGHRQADVVKVIAADAGFRVRLWRDLGHRPRALSLTPSEH